MKNYLIIIFAAFSFFAKAQITTLTPGQTAPEFKLKNVDEKEISFNNYPKAKGFIVVFTCNTCPYSVAYEKRIQNLHTKYESMRYPVIAINPNDPQVSKEDTFEKMQSLAKTKNYTFPYLFDKGQVTTNAYGAKNTPQVFIVSKTEKGNIIEYVGAIDNDTEETKSDRINYVENAIASLMKNEKLSVSTTKAIGCTIKR